MIITDYTGFDGENRMDVQPIVDFMVWFKQMLSDHQIDEVGRVIMYPHKVVIKVETKQMRVAFDDHMEVEIPYGSNPQAVIRINNGNNGIVSFHHFEMSQQLAIQMYFEICIKKCVAIKNEIEAHLTQKDLRVSADPRPSAYRLLLHWIGLSM